MVVNEEGQLHELQLLQSQIVDTSNQIFPTTPIGLTFKYHNLRQKIINLSSCDPWTIFRWGGNFLN